MRPILGEKYMYKNTKFKQHGGEPYPQRLCPLGSSGVTLCTNHATHVAVRLRTALPSTSALATRGFFHGEMHQAAGKGTNAEGEEEASKIQCSLFKCAVADAAH